MPTDARQTPHGRRELKVTRMLLEEPHIELKALATATR